MRRVWLVVALGACVGEINTPAIGSTPTGCSVEGDDDAEVDPPLRRLTATQYRNSVRDFVGQVLGDAALSTTVLSRPAVVASLAALPPDVRPLRGKEDLRGDFRRMDQNIQPAWVEAVASVAEQVGLALARPENLRAIAPCTATAVGPEVSACVDEVITTFGARALRLPQVPDALMAFYRGVYGDTAVLDPAAFADLLGALLGSPQFTYLVEQGSEPVPGRAGVYTLTAPELAARLSYGYWDTVPDDELWAAATSGALLTADGYQRQLERVIADPKASAVIDQFFAEWLQLDLAEKHSLEPLKSNARFQTLLGPSVTDLPSRQALNEEALDFVRYIVWTQGGTFRDLLTSEAATTRDPAMARFYGLSAPWDGTRAPESFPAGSRPGLLTRSGLLAKDTAGSAVSNVDDAKTHPILRGAFLRKEILCDALPPPPANVAEEADRLRGEGAFPQTSSTRKQWEYLTESQAACQGCHRTLLNQLGYTLEGYDALGRVRVEEPLFSADGLAITTRVPIDARTVPQVELGDLRAVDGPAELTTAMAEKAERCFTRTYYSRFLLGKATSLARRACTADGLAAKHLPLKELLLDMALTPAFQRRNFGTPLSP